MRRSFVAGMVGALGLFAVALLDAASAQQVGPGGALNVQKDCQTIRNCRFARDGVFRGCVSSFSCRTCKVVKAPCEIAGAAGNNCTKLMCTWGG